METSEMSSLELALVTVSTDNKQLPQPETAFGPGYNL